VNSENETRQIVPPRDPKRVLRAAATRSLLAILIIAPLLYENIELIRLGYRPSQAGLSIEMGQTMGTLEIEDDQGY
jgi:hypothetical protein